MPLDRRTLRELLATPLTDDDGRHTLLFLATGARWRATLHTLGARVAKARRHSEAHVEIESSEDAASIHIVGVAEDEDLHPVTRKLARRAQAVLSTAPVPRSCRGVWRVDAETNAVAALTAAVEHTRRQLAAMRSRDRRSRPAPEPPPNRMVITRRCDVALLGVVRLTAQELLTALDAVMARGRYRRSRLAGGGRDYVLIRGERGAALRIADDRVGSATDLAVQLAEELGRAVLVATATAAPTEPRGFRLSWCVESIKTSGTAVAYSDHADVGSVDAALDEHLVHHVVSEVFAIQPAREGLGVHYERITR